MKKLIRTTDTGQKLEIVKVYRIFDQIYLDKTKAMQIEEDWFPKDQVQEGYAIFSQYHFDYVAEVGNVPCESSEMFFSTQVEALEELWDEDNF